MDDRSPRSPRRERPSSCLVYDTRPGRVTRQAKPIRLGSHNSGMPDVVDVIVIGAGPAGSVTALLRARRGYSVEIWGT